MFDCVSIYVLITVIIALLMRLHSSFIIFDEIVSFWIDWKAIVQL